MYGPTKFRMPVRLPHECLPPRPSMDPDYSSYTYKIHHRSGRVEVASVNAASKEHVLTWLTYLSLERGFTISHALFRRGVFSAFQYTVPDRFLDDSILPLSDHLKGWSDRPLRKVPTVSNKTSKRLGFPDAMGSDQAYYIHFFNFDL